MSVTKQKVRGHQLIKLRLGLLEFMTIYPDTVHNKKRNRSGWGLLTGWVTGATSYTINFYTSIDRWVLRTVIFK